MKSLNDIDIEFMYTKLGEPVFVKRGSKFAGTDNTISFYHWTPDKLEAIAKAMRDNPELNKMRES